ncbi:MAG: tetratricopeptide repeat protein [Pyrinomonadaceae bacterium]
MKKLVFTIFSTLVLTISVAAQGVDKPKLTATPPTPEQAVMIREGIAFQNARQFDAAIAKYELILQANPDCTEAIYQLALAHYSKPDTAKADTIARKGAQYKSDQLPLFLTLIAHNLDEARKPSDAMKLYKEAIKLLKDKSERRLDYAEANYNLAFAQVRQKQYDEAKATLKVSLTANSGHASSNYQLMEIYYGTLYKMPALLAATRLLGVERDTPRSKRAAEIFLDILKPAKKDGQTGNINIFLNMDAPKDEGDFGMYELFLGTITTVRGDDDKGKSDNEMFADGVSSIFAIVTEDKDLPKSFVGKTYSPYLAAMKDAGHVQTFAYVVLQLGGNADATKWVEANSGKVNAFFSWAKNYQRQ